MDSVVITGASRGIGRALTLALAQPGQRLTLLARDRAALDTVASEANARGAKVEVLACDLADVDAARATGAELGTRLQGAVLVHNAGLWPSRCERITTPWGEFERAYVVNHLAPLALQQPLLTHAGALSRVIVVSAGLIALGRFDPERTPTGRDFSALKTYARTKLCFAAAAREFARSHAQLDVLALHPGVARTDLGNRGGVVGALLRLVKKKWEDPATTGARIARVMARPDRTPTAARYFIEEAASEWPKSVVDAEAAVVKATRAFNLL